MYSYVSSVMFWLKWREHWTEEEFSDTNNKERAVPDTGTLSCLWSRQHYLPDPNTIFVGVSGRKLHRGDWIPFDRG